MAQKKATRTDVKVFLSYIHEDEYLAKAIQEKINSILLGTVDFFVASLPASVKAGGDVVKEIEKRLRIKNVVAIVLCSRTSISRAWVNFECGAAWMSKILNRCSTVIPLCHGGLKRGELTGPLRDVRWQALELRSEEDITTLISELVVRAGIDMPKNFAKKFISELPPSPEMLDVEQIEAAQKALTETLELTCSKLREGKTSAKDIQRVVTSIVTVWSRAVYSQDKPPPPSGVAIPGEPKWPCKLCELNVHVTPEGCCENCNLFCSDWLRIVPF